MDQYKKCPFCAELIRAEATVCKHCQRDQPVKQAPIEAAPPAKKAAQQGITMGQWFLIFGVAFLVLMIWGYSLDDSEAGTSSAPRPTATPRPPDKMDAFQMCTQFVTDRLKSPKTAEFPSSFADDVSTVAEDKDTFRVRAYVDSQNGFGALVRTRYTCTVTNTSGKRWLLDSLVTDD